MKHGPVLAIVTLAGTIVSGLAADDGPDPAPPGCHWQAITILKAHLAVPDGWEFRDTSTHSLLSYEVRPAGPGFKNARSRYRLEVRRGVDKSEVVKKAREFVESARTGATEAQPLEEQQVGVLILFSSFATYDPHRPGVTAVSVAISSAANTRTGTLYTVRFDIPSDEVERVAELGNQLFQKMRLDDEI